MTISEELWQRFEKTLSRRDTAGLAVADAIDFIQSDAEVTRRLAKYREAKLEVEKLLQEMDAQEATPSALADPKEMPPAVRAAEGVEKPNN